MGNDLEKGTTYAEGGVGGVGTVNATNLNAHVDAATIKATFISGKTLKDPAALDDAIVVENSGVLYRETLQQIMDIIAESVSIPVGIITDFAGTTAPEGWLLCYGQAISRTTYNLLFDCIGITYGAGDSVSTFNVPDLRGMVTAGKDNMGGTASGRLSNTYLSASVLNSGGGAEAHTLTEAQLASHAHMFTGGTFAASSVAISGYYVNSGGGPIGETGGVGFTPNVPTTFGGSVQTPVSGPTDYRGSNNAHLNLQPTRILNKIIRYL